MLIFVFMISGVALANDDRHHATKDFPPHFMPFPDPKIDSPPGYFAMTNNVVNFRGESQARLLAVDLKFMSFYPDIVGEEGWMEALRPVLKNDLDRILRQQTYSGLRKLEGTDLMREEILQMARDVLEDHNIYPNLIAGVFITRFVMQ